MLAEPASRPVGEVCGLTERRSAPGGSEAIAGGLRSSWLRRLIARGRTFAGGMRRCRRWCCS
jgi:hypothetical protein